MNKGFKFLMIIGLSVAVLSSCKTKQKVTDLTGANKPAVEASSEEMAVVQPAATSTLKEVTRNETFKLADGETNTSAMSKKYHVVVGSFSIQSNAINLRNTLLNEGNEALIVVNENGMFRVLVASFNDYTVAHQKIDAIKSRFADAWVLVQK